MTSLSELNKHQNNTTSSYIVLTGSTAGGVNTSPVYVQWAGEKGLYEAFSGAITIAGHLRLSGTAKNLKMYVRPVYANNSKINNAKVTSLTYQSISVISISGASITASITDSGVIGFEMEVSNETWWKPSIGAQVYFGITASATAAGSTVFHIDPYVLSQKNFR